MKKRFLSWLLVLSLAIPFAWAEDISGVFNGTEEAQDTDITASLESSVTDDYAETEAHAETIVNRANSAAEDAGGGNPGRG